MDEADGYNRKLESEGNLRAVMQDANERLQVMAIRRGGEEREVSRKGRKSERRR